MHPLKVFRSCSQNKFHLMGKAGQRCPMGSRLSRAQSRQRQLKEISDAPGVPCTAGTSEKLIFKNCPLPLCPEALWSPGTRRAQ